MKVLFEALLDGPRRNHRKFPSSLSLFVILQTCFQSYLILTKLFVNKIAKIFFYHLKDGCEGFESSQYLCCFRKCNNVVFFFTLLSFEMPIFVHREICKKYKFPFENCIVGATNCSDLFQN